MAPPPHTSTALTAEQLLAEAGFLRRLARDLVRDDSRADDLVQDTFAAALEHPPSRQGSLRGWLATIARNLSRNAHRGEQRRAAREVSAARPERVEPAALGLERLELSREILGHVMSLPDEQRAVLYLRYYEDLTPTEIAARLGLPLKTIASRQGRGLQKLRERLDARSGADRRVWMLALLPIARTPATGVIPGVFGGLAMKKVLACAALALLLLLGWFAYPRLVSVRHDTGVAHHDVEAKTEPAPAAAPLAEEVVAARRAQVATATEATPAATSGSADIRLSWSDGTPAAGVIAAIARPRPRGARREWWRATTDADGRMRFDGLAIGTQELRVDLRGSFELEIRAGETTSAALTLPHRIEATGRVIDEDGAPIRGAVIAYDARGGWAPDLRALATTDASGRFALRDVDADYAIGARAAGHLPSPLVELRDMDSIGAGRREFEFRLKRGGPRLRGRVLAPSGEPLAGARVLAGPRNGHIVQTESGASALAPALFAVTSDAEGRFELLDSLPEGPQPLHVVAYGHAPWTGEVAMPADAGRELEIRLAPAARIEGRVLGIDGRPASGVRVTQSREERGGWHHDSIPSATDQTDADGWFELEWIEPGSREVCASDSQRPELGRARATLECAPGQVTRCELVLELGRQISGRVIDEQGAPLSGWLVRSEGSDFMRRWYPRHATTGADGAFRLANLGEGTHVLKVHAPGYGAARLEVMGIACGAEGLELVVPNARVVKGTVRGRFVDASGAAIDDVTVTLWRAGQREGYFLELDPATGRFEGEAFPGKYRLSFVRRNADIAAVPELEIEEARVTDVGEVACAPSGDVELVLEGLDPKSLGRIHLSLSREGLSDPPLVNDNGTLRASGVLAGTWKLEIFDRELSIDPRSLDVLAGGTTRAVVTVRVRGR